MYYFKIGISSLNNISQFSVNHIGSPLANSVQYESSVVHSHYIKVHQHSKYSITYLFKFHEAHYNKYIQQEFVSVSVTILEQFLKRGRCWQVHFVNGNILQSLSLIIDWIALIVLVLVLWNNILFKYLFKTVGQKWEVCIRKYSTIPKKILQAGELVTVESIIFVNEIRMSARLQKIFHNLTCGIFVIGFRGSTVIFVNVWKS